MLEKDIGENFDLTRRDTSSLQRTRQRVNRNLPKHQSLVVGVLKGAVPFMADIVRSIDTYLELDFMDVSSYGNATVSSGEVKIVKDLDTNVEGRDLLIVEDIIDSGRTLAYLVDLFKYRKAKSVKIVTLLGQTRRKSSKHRSRLCWVQRTKMNLLSVMAWIMQKHIVTFRTSVY